MASEHELARGRERLRALIEVALGEGWRVVRTSGGHLKFTKPGCASIYTSSTASDHRADRNARAQLRRADRQRSEEHTSELQSLMRISYAAYCLKKKHTKRTQPNKTYTQLRDNKHPTKQK